MIELRIAPQFQSAPTIIAILLAFLVGLIIATQPLWISVAALVIVIFLLLAVISPLAILVIAVILAPLRALILTESSAQLPLDIGQITLLMVIASWFTYRTSRNEPLLSLNWTPIYLPVILFAAISSLTAFTAVSTAAWLNEWLKWLLILLLMILLVSYTEGREWHWLVLGLMLSGIANAVVGIYQFFGGSGALHLLINDRFFRAFGTFGQPNPFGAFMGLLAPLALTGAVAYGSRLWRHKQDFGAWCMVCALYAVFYSISSGLLIIALIMSWSRGAWLGFAGAVAVMLFAVPRRSWQSLLLVGGVGMMVAGLWFSGRLPASITSRLSTTHTEFLAFQDVRGVDITPENFAILERLAHWQAAINMATANPILGVGLGNYEAAYEDYRLLNWPAPLGHAHNYYLNVLAEAGIMGAFGYLALWISIIWYTWRLSREADPQTRLFAIGFLGAWVYLLIHSLTDNLFVNNLFIHIGVMLGILSILHNRAQLTRRLK